MIFSTELKNELSRKEINNRDFAIAELTAYMRTKATIIYRGNLYSIRFETTNNSTIRRIFKLIKFLYKYDGKIIVSKISNLKRNNLYKLLIDCDNLAKTILKDTKFSEIDSLLIVDDLINMVNRDKNFKINFLIGLFLGSGSISNPDSSYHLEFSLNSKELSDMVIKYLKSFRIKSKYISKKGYSIVYLKDSNMISDFISLVGAVETLFKFEEVKIIKEIKNNTNRLTNCETANLDKTLNNSFKQIDAIKKMYKKYGKDNIDKNLLELSEIRLKNPSYSLQTIAEILNISKSGVNHRFKKIIELSKDKE